jgi:hypothetical protein
VRHRPGDGLRINVQANHFNCAIRLLGESSGRPACSRQLQPFFQHATPVAVISAQHDIAANRHARTQSQILECACDSEIDQAVRRLRD